MKANINREKIILYHLRPENGKGKAIQKLLDDMRIQAIFIRESELQQSLGYLLGLPGFEEGSTQQIENPPNDEFMAFYGFSDARLDQFLAIYRARMIEAVPLKAVVTDTNRNWKLIDLLSELKKEHLYFQKRGRLQQLLMKSILPGVHLSPEDTADLEKGKRLMAESEPDLAEMDRIIRQLEQSLGQI